MSNPPSSLANALSYSYHHILVISDCTDTADALAESQDPNIWEHATPETAVSDEREFSKMLGRYAPKQLENSGKYVVLINGMTDAAFTISSAKWSTATAASARPNDQGTSIAIEGSLTISEPRGVEFLDQVIRSCIALGIDASQAIFSLKTFFVTHSYSPDRGEYSEIIADIPPINFLTYDATGKFTEAGGVYELQFVSIGHGAARLPQYGKAVNAISITAGNTLGETFTRLQNNINQNYDRYFGCVYEQIRQATANLDTDAFLKSLRRVKYVIDVAEVYKGAEYTVTNQMQQFKNGAGCNDNAQINFPASSSIEQAIGTIMMMSPRVQMDMSQGDASDKRKYEYKIHTMVESKPVDGKDQSNLEYTVYYRVERFLTPKSISYDPLFHKLAQEDAEIKADPLYEQLRRNIIEYDYIYTGKNVDIIDFDMQVNMGMSYLQTATLANTFKSQLERGPNRQMQVSTQDANNQGVRFGGSLVQVPVFFGTQINTPGLTNQQNASNAIQSAYTLSKHSSLEVTEASMTIHGNPALLGSTNITSSPRHIRKGQTVITEKDGQFQDWTYIPAFAKINIKMPRSNDDYDGFTGNQTGTNSAEESIDYARDFWFDGYYYIYGIEHTFDGGLFTQVLQMIGIPKKSAFDASKETSSREVDTTKNISQCFDNQIACGTQQSSVGKSDIIMPQVAVPEVPPSGDTTPTTIADVTTVTNAAGEDPSVVIGWNKASKEVQQAIINAAKSYNMSVVTMAQMAYIESTFNPNAHPKGSPSSATGLYQFLRDTWNGLVKQGSVIGVDRATGIVTNTSKTPQPGDPRFNPQWNANAGAAFMRNNARAIGSSSVGDLYLAHFLGEGGAKKVIRDCDKTGGTSSVVTLFGENEAARVIKANASIVNRQTTGLGIRTWAATKMAATLTTKPAVAANTAPKAAEPERRGFTDATVPPAIPSRTADQPVAAVQNCKAQDLKQDINPCGPSPQNLEGPQR